VKVAFATTDTTPLNQGFAGFACEMLDTGLEYGNTNFQQRVAKLSPGWIRYPSGISDDAFDWATGLTDTNWINTIGMRGDGSASNGARWIWGSMREILRRILSPLARGEGTENFLSAEYLQEIEMRLIQNGHCFPAFQA
jgi:hypothetical protein